MEFRAQFFAGIVSYLIWAGVSLLFIEVVFGNVGPVSGWSREEMWVLYGTFVILESMCYGLLGANMFRFSSTVRDGSLDLILTRPLNTQFFVSTRYVDPNGVLNSIPGFALILFGLNRIGHFPSLLEWISWLALSTCGFVIAYAIWFLFVTLSIWAIKLEGIAVVFDPMMQMARFPLQIYPQRMQGFLTFVLPVAFMTTFPTEALLGRGHLSTPGTALVVSAVLLYASHRFFNYALKFYGSASS